MIPYNNSIIVPVDTGYGNIKNSLHSFPTGIAAYNTKPAFEGKILHINNMYYRIGEGHKEYIPDKTVDEEFRLLTIAAICDECRSCGYYEGNIYLAVGCPTTMVTAQRESTREYFLKEPHIDCEYIAVCPYDLDGIRWHSNRKSLDFVRKRSDEICLEHNLDIIRNPRKKGTISYKEHDARKKGYSWKVKMADTIDRLIHSDDVTDIYSLIEKMKECGYTFTNESRMIAKPKGVKYGCCIAKLGFGYSYQMLMQRINNKQNEFVGRKISAFIGFQVEIAVGLRERQLDIYRSLIIHSVSHVELQRTAEVLCFIHNNHIHSLDDMRACLAAANRKEDNALYRYFKLADKKEQLKTLNYLGDEYARLLKTENRDEAQQKRLEDLHWKLAESGGIGGWNTHMDNWLPKLKDKLRNDLRQLDSLATEMGRASKERTNAETALAYLEDFLKSDYDRIREQEQLRIQIESYHNGLEPQEDGTYKAESMPTAERNAEFAYLDMREEQRRRDERQREKRNRSRSGYCR